MMGNAWLYTAEVLILLAVVPGMLWLKREGDRHWALHVRRRVWVRIVVDTTAFTHAIAKATAAAAEMDRVMRQVGEAIRTTPTPRLRGEREGEGQADGAS